MPDQFVTIVVGGVAGGLVSYVVQSLRQFAIDRRLFRSAALLVRQEIIGNQAAVATLLQGDKASAVERSLMVFQDHIFDRQADRLAAGMSSRHFVAICGLYWGQRFPGAVVAYWSKHGKIHENDRRFLEKWLPEAQTCQRLLLFELNGRVFRWRYRKEWAEIRQALTRLESEATAGFEQRGMGRYFKLPKG